MTNQEAFETMVRHLRRQGKRSVRIGAYTCLYRGPNGLRCAVGCLIPDDQYKRSLEGKAASCIANKVPALSDIGPGLLSEMQSVHDDLDVSQWEEGFKDVAQVFSLTLPPLEEAPHA